MNGKYFQDLQNGSHPKSPVNEALALLMDLQNDLQDIADGFEARLTQVTRRGYQTLSGEIETAPEPEVSALPIQLQEQAASDGDISDALLSRSAEEVVAALGRAQQFEDSSLSAPETYVAELSTGISEDAPEPTSDTSTSANPEPVFSILPITHEEGKPIEIVDAALSYEKEQIEHVMKSLSTVEDRLTSSPRDSIPTDSEPEVSILPVPKDEL